MSHGSPHEAHVYEKSKVTFKKSQKLLAENFHKRLPIQNIQLAIYSMSKADYVTAILTIFCTELHDLEASSLPSYLQP